MIFIMYTIDKYSRPFRKKNRGLEVFKRVEGVSKMYNILVCDDDREIEDDEVEEMDSDEGEESEL